MTTELKHALINPFSGSDSLCGKGCSLTMDYDAVNCPDCRELMKGKAFAASVAHTNAIQADAERQWRRRDPIMARLNDWLKR